MTAAATGRFRLPSVPMSLRDDAAPPGVPGYTLQELLGRGGSGEVWRAVPRAGGAPVAVKVLIAGDPERQAREAALLGELDHPHLVRLRDVVHQPRRGGEARVALVLDLLPGGSLAALLARRGRLRPGEVVTAIAPVAAAGARARARRRPRGPVAGQHRVHRRGPSRAHRPGRRARAGRDRGPRGDPGLRRPDGGARRRPR